MKRLTVLAAFLAACGGSDKSSSGPDAADPMVDGSVTPRIPATHFDTTAVNFTVPSSGLAEGFARDFSFASQRYWNTTDLDGDGFLDIVHTGDTAFTTRVWDATGSPYWKVYAGNASGWSASAVNWPVSKNGRTEGFFATGATGTGIDWVLVDVDGDKRRDLVHSLDPATGRVWDATGVPHWKVYMGMPNGFAATAVTWGVPQSGTTNGFTTPVLNSGALQWATLDVTGDGKADLVQTCDPVTGRVWDATNAPHWKVFANTGSGFATQATLFSVPSSGTFGGFDSMTVSAGVEQWVTVDLDHDGKLDIVQTADTATGTVWDAAGAPYWKLFRGTATGFEASPKNWRVPKSGLSDGFSMARSETTARRWLLVDLDGDDDLDLVQTGDTAFTRRVRDATGNPYWKVFANKGGDGFSEELYRWPVPLGPTDGFAETTISSGAFNWFLADVDHDGYRDLVHTMNPATSAAWDATGAAYWKVYRGKP
jgi:hypothetical protein